MQTVGFAPLEWCLKYSFQLFNDTLFAHASGIRCFVVVLQPMIWISTIRPWRDESSISILVTWRMTPRTHMLTVSLKITLPVIFSPSLKNDWMVFNIILFQFSIGWFRLRATIIRHDSALSNLFNKKSLFPPNQRFNQNRSRKSGDPRRGFAFAAAVIVGRAFRATKHVNQRAGWDSFKWWDLRWFFWHAESYLRGIISASRKINWK